MRALLVLAALAIATTAHSEPPRDPTRQANCPKGFYKWRGDCWRRIDDVTRNESFRGTDEEPSDFELEVDRRLDRLEQERPR